MGLHGSGHVLFAHSVPTTYSLLQMMSTISATQISLPMSCFNLALLVKLIVPVGFCLPIPDAWGFGACLMFEFPVHLPLQSRVCFQDFVFDGIPFPAAGASNMRSACQV